MTVRDAAFVLGGAATALLAHALVVRWRARSERAAATHTAAATHRVPLKALRDFAADVFVSCGLERGDAATAADVLTLADARGIDSHGIARLAAYFTMLRSGKINPRPDVRVVRETASTACVDGDNGLGLVVGPRANEIAMEKAKAAGSGWVAVRNTTHFGIAGSYSLRAIENDMIGPPGGLSPRLRLPCCISLPRGAIVYRCVPQAWR